MTQTHLFSPLSIKSVTLRNRIAVSPMCQYSCEDGFATDWHLVHLGSRAVGGAGLVMMEATAVEPRGRITPGDHGLWKDEHIAKLAQITAFIKSQGAAPGIQIAHAGRKASCRLPWNGGAVLEEDEGRWQTVAPSAVAFRETEPVPAALSESEIAGLVQAFADTAKRALKAGFEVLEIHAAHGYLLHEFLSPLSNKRTDSYGGSFENRIRFVLQVTDAVRAVWPERLPLFVRISASDWAEGGWNEEESIRLAALLKTKGVDLIDCSSGGLVPHVRIPNTPGYQVPFAQHIRQEADIMTGAVGLITQAQQADDIIRTGQADLVLLAREFLRDPYWPLHAAKILKAEINPPVQYERAFK
ncbi:MAG TPA: NADPH dehydrogenase NamA [Rickettsiales bacterium]|nr:NADPH dehydrogenase NamA [Rickettsiales bacterium]